MLDFADAGYLHVGTAMVRIPDWQLDALCAEYDKAAFFSMSPVTIARAKKVCARCPVRAECLAYAYETEAVGVWGGTSTGDRKGQSVAV